MVSFSRGVLRILGYLRVSKSASLPVEGSSIGQEYELDEISHLGKCSARLLHQIDSICYDLRSKDKVHKAEVRSDGLDSRMW